MVVRAQITKTPFLFFNLPIFFENGKYVLIDFHTSKVLILDKDPRQINGLEKILEDAGIIRDIILNKNEQRFTSLALFPTRNCNMGCIYCYASNERDSKDMDTDLAIVTLNIFLDQLGDLKPRITFHGGGEPTLRFDLIKEVIKNLSNKEYDAFLTSNGTAKPEVYEWLLDQNFSITISIDGPANIQNNQRPLKNGKESSKLVEKTMDLISKKRSLSVRPTITKESLRNIDQLMTYFRDHGVKRILFEPLVNLEKGKPLKNNSLGVNEIILGIKKAYELAKDFGMTISRSCYSFAPHERVYHCGAFSGSCMAVTPEGYLSSCFEVTGPSHILWNKVCLGYIDYNNKKLILNESKRKELQSRNVLELESCNNCFSKFICAGGCGIRALEYSGKIQGVSQFDCELTKRNIEMIAHKCYLESIRGS